MAKFDEYNDDGLELIIKQFGWNHLSTKLMEFLGSEQLRDISISIISLISALDDTKYIRQMIDDENLL